MDKNIAVVGDVSIKQKDLVEKIEELNKAEEAIETVDENAEKEIKATQELVKDMANDAKKRIIEEEAMTGLIQLPGNRKNRRKLMKQIKIPKSRIFHFSEKDADNYTKSCKKNEIKFEAPKEKIDDSAKPAVI